MTPESRRLVRESWERVEPVAGVAAALFYGRLFELDPGLRHLFRGDMAEQGRKLMQTLGAVARGPDRMDFLLPGAGALGRRHAAYGVESGQYDTVAQALLWTLERALADAFTPEVRAAWGEAYDLLAGAMKRASAGVPGLPPVIHPVSSVAGAAD